MKKVLLLGNINSSHMQKWATGISSLGFETGIFSLSPPEADWFSEYKISLLNNDSFVNSQQYFKSDYSKIKYLKVSSSLKKIIRSFSPDIIHAHYATSYGILGALSGHHPFLVSFWGSDVFDFPNRSFLHRSFIKFVMKRADGIISASKIMKEEIGKYSDKKVDIIPLGIETDKFYNFKKGNPAIFTIGIIKSLEVQYGIDNLIRAFGVVVEKYKNREIRLLIVGDGTLKNNLKELARELNIESLVAFTGKVRQDMVPTMHNKIDLFVCPSVRESFGVSVLEASACEVPVIVSNVGGLPEVVVDSETGLILEQNTVSDLVDAISYFLDNPEKLEEYGKKGRRFVEEKYDWMENLVLIQKMYGRF